MCFSRIPTARGGIGPATSWSPRTDGNFRFLGRRDRMIKKRGYRVELGEIEAALYRHPDVQRSGRRRRLE